MATEVIREPSVHKEETIQNPQWEMYLFVLDESLKYTAYLVCKGRKRFYKINIWTLTKKEGDKWYTSPRITSEITSRSLKQKLKALTEADRFGNYRSYRVPITGEMEISVNDPNLPLDVIMEDCVVNKGIDGNFTRIDKEELKKLIAVL